MQQQITFLLKRLWIHVNPRRRRQFLLLLLLMLLASFAEILSIGALLPFLAVLTAPERILELPLAQPFFVIFRIVDPSQLLLPLTITFVFAAIVAGAMRLLLLWATTKLSFAAGADISSGIYYRTLHQPYAVHCSRNSSEVINGISGKANSVIYNVIVPTLTFISASIMLIVILITLMILNPIVALSSFGGFGFIYLVIVRFTRHRLQINSQITAAESTQVIKSLQEGLGGIRDVLIDGSQAIYCEIYTKADLPLRRAQANNMFINSGPRYAMEALGMAVIAIIAFALVQQSDGLVKVVPLLGALALGAQRLLPVLQQVYASWTSVTGSQATLNDVLELLEQPLVNYGVKPVRQLLNFNKSISLKQVSFRYSNKSKNVLNKVSITIAKGSRVGFVGTTGSGKSTLLDLIMGLLQPTHGRLEVDGQIISIENQQSWQAHIAHVPQAIYLADSSIEENIAFGVPKDRIDNERVRYCAKQAQVAECIENWPDQYKTLVGEAGVRLSGGQRQRIGIARALYKKADIIIFDEATSALDSDTEQAVMQAIEGLSKDLTLLIIAHRLTTLKNCSQIVKLVDGEIKGVESYTKLINISDS